jgi:hypothetical protein
MYPTHHPLVSYVRACVCICVRVMGVEPGTLYMVGNTLPLSYIPSPFTYSLIQSFVVLRSWVW